MPIAEAFLLSDQPQIDPSNLDFVRNMLRIRFSEGLVFGLLAHGLVGPLSVMQALRGS